MKKSIVAAMCLLFGCTLCLAQDFKAGGHIAYSAGGDVAEKNFGGGAQFNAAVNESLSLDLAGTYFPEENGRIDGGIATFALSARVGKYVADGTHLYIGAGPNVSFFEALNLDTSIGYHFSAGAELTLGRGFEFLADYRYSIVDVDNNRDDNFRFAFGLVRLGVTYEL